MRDVLQFLRANPQAAILLAICLILGFGTLIAVIISALSSGATPASSGGDAGVIGLLRVIAP
jgi:hypothetical protein